jgi:hypothetical protein
MYTNFNRESSPGSANPSAAGILWGGVLLALGIVASAGVPVSVQQQPEPQLEAGTAAVDITPAPGTPMGGGFTPVSGHGVHDPLACKAIALKSGGARAALVSCDVESLHRPTVLQARSLISRLCKTPPDHVMIAATHTHSGPEMTPALVTSASGEAGERIRRFHRELPQRIAKAVQEAESNLRPVRAASAIAHEDSISFNRRFLLKNGAVRMNPGQMNPEIVRAMGPIDPEVSVVYFEDAAAAPVATHVNFALHTTVWGQKTFSADYPGVVAELLKGVKGGGMLTLFTNGASGNINQVDHGSLHPAFGPEETRRVGTILAASVMKAYKKLLPAAGGPLVVKRSIVKLPVPAFSEEEVAAARETMKRSERGEHVDFLPLVHAYRVLAVAETHGGRPVEAEIQVIALGTDIAWVAFPGEVFVELGLAVKRASPFRHTVFNELANDMIDYIPDRKAFDEGGYEVTTARCIQGCGEMLVEEAVRLLTEAYRQARPYRMEGDNTKLRAGH